MKALVVPRVGAGLAACAVIDVDAPIAAPGELVVDVRAAALNVADAKLATGAFTARFVHARTTPCRLGYDVSGVVVAAAGAFAPGDEVFGFLSYASSTTGGTCAARVAVSSSNVARKPPSVPHADAAAIATAGASALQSLRDDGKLVAGGRVFVHGGSGGVGACAVQIAKQIGASYVAASASSSKHDFVRGLGADRVVDHRTTAVRDLGERFDVVLDAAVKSSFFEARAVLAPRGAYVTTLPTPGFAAGKIASAFTSRRAVALAVQPRPDDLARLATWVAEGRLRAPIGEIVSLDDAPAALARLASGAVAGKIVVAVAA